MATPSAPARTAPTPQPVNHQPTAAPPATKAGPPATKSRLTLVKRGLLREAKRFHFFGPGGIGKTLLAADAPTPIFIDSDTGSGHLDLPRYPFRDGEDGHVPRKIEEVYAAIEDLTVNPHEYRTLVLDVSSGIERLIHARVLAETGPDRAGNVAKTIADIPFGRGPAAALGEWRILLERLDVLRLRRGVHVVWISHCTVRKFKSPVSEDYSRYEPDIDSIAAGALYQWCEVVGFVSFDDVGSKRKKETKAIGEWAGTRVIHLEHSAAWDAKSRLPLPAEIDLPEARPFAPFLGALDQLYTSAADLRTAIDVELARLGETFLKPDGKESSATAVRAAVGTAGDNTGELTKFLNTLKQAQPKEQTP